MADYIRKDTARRIIDSPRNREQMLAILKDTPSEDVIPVSWIEERIKWLIGTGNEFALLTAETFFSLLMAWRDKAKDDWASYEKDGEQNA